MIRAVDAEGAKAGNELRDEAVKLIVNRLILADLCPVASGGKCGVMFESVPQAEQK